MARNNYPQSQIEDIEPSAVQELVTSLRMLHDKGKPKTDDEIKQRIDDFFMFCERSSLRPGIETLSAALCISRVTLYKWANGQNCSVKCQEYVQSAKALIAAYIEQAMLGGKISPPSGIFLMKNWLNYKDSVSIEENIPDKVAQRALSAAELPRLDVSDLPQLSVFEEGKDDI